MRASETLGAAIRDSVDFAQNDELICLRQGQCHLAFAGHLLAVHQTEGFTVPRSSLIQIGHFDAHVADATQRNWPRLWRQIRWFSPNIELNRVAVGVEDKQ